MNIDDILEFILTYYWVVVLVVLSVCIAGSVYLVQYIQEHGLKSIVEAIWYGTK